MLTDPIEPAAAKALIRQILDEGTVRFTKHARDSMEQRDLDEVDCTNVLRGGSVQPPELENGSWRYRISTARMCVVVAFRSEDTLVVVTAWRC